MRDAILWSVGANAAHGLRRTNDDKRRAVMKLLGDGEWTKWSDREIARRCGVNHEMVGGLRPKPVSGGNRQIERPRLVERGGKVYEQNTAAIGRKPAPEPASPRGKIGDALMQTVNARDLHAFLEVGSAFKDWIARRIDEYGFLEGRDFCSFLSESSGGRPAKEYAVTLDMAKELSMVERNDKGKQARRPRDSERGLARRRARAAGRSPRRPPMPPAF